MPTVALICHRRQRSGEGRDFNTLSPLPLCPSAVNPNVPKIIPAELPPRTTRFTLRPLHGRRPQKPRHLRRGFARLSVHLRVLFVIARHSGACVCHGCFLGLHAAAAGSRGHAVQVVDRTFNLHLPTSSAILQFFLDRWRDDAFLHFEMVPDRLPEQLRGLIRQFPAGAVQFEVGIQTFDDATSKNINRRQNLDRLADNFRFLREETGVHIHADLIVGLPGEGIESFGRGFDRLVRLGPQKSNRHPEATARHAHRPAR